MDVRLLCEEVLTRRNCNFKSDSDTYPNVISELLSTLHITIHVRHCHAHDCLHLKLKNNDVLRINIKISGWKPTTLHSNGLIVRLVPDDALAGGHQVAHNLVITN